MCQLATFFSVVQYGFLASLLKTKFRSIILMMTMTITITEFQEFVKMGNGFHVTVRLFSNRSQKTSKRGKNISDTVGYRFVCPPFFLFLPHFDVICDLLLNRRMATWNPFVKWSTHSDDVSKLRGFIGCYKTK